jgi:hypothetical protein
MEQSKPTRSISCKKCDFCEEAVSAGDEYTFINPVGAVITRVHSDSMYICRFWPPIAGQWPQVEEEDWCAQFKRSEQDGPSGTTKTTGS